MAKLGVNIDHVATVRQARRTYEPDPVWAAAECGAPFIELHTGTYANARDEKALKRELVKLTDGSRLAQNCGIRVNAGHGLNYRNTTPVASIAGMEELNIGHAIMSRAVFVGLKQAVREMIAIIK